ncbi:hypothetical protein [Sulfuriroseicoccus oceanibius]|uniref:Uncharacterized protein n=1 Tax=Sulfuriroseicoccus oceanibius TaxID=2707525 RepID=A0A6B3L5W1_9BACT|nr:hypothetical protein [Sulfuriroseicoccus oceanibius]QQL44111.1 hypothetical protein G3M56_009410 [Sulfuriroseicoccus oceanibius]
MKITTTLVTSTVCCATAMASPLSDWFASPAAERGQLPESFASQELNSRDKVELAKQQVWQEYKAAATKLGWDKNIPTDARKMDDWINGNQIKPLVAKLGEKTMPYVVITNGEKPADGWPVYFCFHGGGRNPHATEAQTWPVNTKEWLAQMHLATTKWDAPGLYIIPRMADDRDGRWYYGYNQEFIDRMIHSAILFNDADPNKFFIMGISEGGYAAFRLGSMMADRWAGACGMAASEPLNTSPPENLRHVAFRCGIGENDTMFNRHILARDYFKELAKMAEANPGQYINFHDEQKGMGHGIDYEHGPRWISKYERTPTPKTITWTVIKQHDRHRNRLYWLVLDDYQGDLPLKLTAEATKGNVINLTAHTEKDGKLSEPQNLKLRVYLDESLADLAKPVTIRINGDEVFKGQVEASMEAIVRSTAERGDPEQVYPVQVPVAL